MIAGVSCDVACLQAFLSFGRGVLHDLLGLVAGSQ